MRMRISFFKIPINRETSSLYAYSAQLYKITGTVGYVFKSESWILSNADINIIAKVCPKNIYSPIRLP